MSLLLSSAVILMDFCNKQTGAGLDPDQERSVHQQFFQKETGMYLHFPVM